MNAIRAAISALFLLAIPVAAFAQPTLAPIQITIPGGGGGGGGGCSLSLTAATANIVLSPNPLTCTGGATIATTQPLSVQSNPVNYAITPSTDAGALVQITSSSDTAPTLSDATVSGFGAGFGFDIVSNSGPITLTLPGASTIGGLSALALANNQYAGVVSDGNNYQLALGMPPSCSGVLAGPSGSSGVPACRAIVSLDLPATPLSIGTTVSLTGPRQYVVCTSTCTITPPPPVAGYEFCVENDDNVTTVITFAALGSGARYENTARSAYGTAGTGTLISGGAVGDKVCILGRDATHYLTQTFTGTWTAS